MRDGKRAAEEIRLFLESSTENASRDVHA